MKKRDKVMEMELEFGSIWAELNELAEDMLSFATKNHEAELMIREYGAMMRSVQKTANTYHRAFRAMRNNDNCMCGEIEG